MSNKPRFTQELVEKKETGENSGFASRMVSKFRNASRATRLAIFGAVAIGGAAASMTLLPEEDDESAPSPMASANMDVARRQRAEKKAKEEAAKNQESAEDAVTIEETVAKAPVPPEDEALEETEPPLTFAKKVEWRIAFLQSEITRLENALNNQPMDSDMLDRCILQDYRNELQLWWSGQIPMTEKELDGFHESVQPD